MKRHAFSCLVCGTKGQIREDAYPVHCVCGYTQFNPGAPGLGDRVAAVLHRLGITPEIISGIKARIGAPGRCNCHKRQQALNAAVRKLGIGV